MPTCLLLLTSLLALPTLLALHSRSAAQAVKVRHLFPLGATFYELDLGGIYWQGELVEVFAQQVLYECLLAYLPTIGAQSHPSLHISPEKRNPAGTARWGGRLGD